MKLDFRDYDQRNYPMVAPAEGYAEWASRYDQQVTQEMDLALLEAVRAVDWPTMARAVDLACGTGRVGTWLRAKGVPSVDGVDITPEMLAIARAKGVYADLRCEDIRETSLAGSSYDLVTNVLSVEHLPELGPLYREAARLGTAAATFVIVGFHPYFPINGIPTHFERADGSDLSITTYIHLHSHHVQAARAAGWSLEEMRERIVDERCLAENPKWERHRGRPISLLMVWKR